MGEFPPPTLPPPVSAAVARGPLNLDMASPTLRDTTTDLVSPLTPDTPLPMLPDLPRVLARGPLMLRLTPTPLMLVTDSPTAAPLMPPTPFITLPCTTATATDTTTKLLLALG